MLRDETIERVVRFRDDRNWRQFHTPKDLALSLTLEAAELLEVFQWSGGDTECWEKLDKIRTLSDQFDQCMRGCAMAIGCTVDITTTAGYMPLDNDDELCEPATAIKFAVASSAWKHTIRGDVNYASTAESMGLRKGNTSGRVKR